MDEETRRRCEEYGRRLAEERTPLSDAEIDVIVKILRRPARPVKEAS
jgi:hypothetical protein